MYLPITKQEQLAIGTGSGLTKNVHVPVGLSMDLNLPKTLSNRREVTMINCNVIIIFASIV